MSNKSTPFAVATESENDVQLDPLKPPRLGDPCPNCGKGKLDYNGLLELECPLCGYRNTGGAIGT